MKILAITYMYPSVYLEYSGIFIHKQLLGLQRLGHEVEVLKLHPWVPSVLKVLPRYRQLGAIPKQYNWEGIGVNVAFMPPVKGALALRSNPILMTVRSVLEGLKRRHDWRKFDLFFGHELHKGAPAAVALGKLFGKPSVVFGYGRDLNVYAKTDPFLRSIVCRTLRNANGILVVSNPMKQTALNLCSGIKDVVVNPTGVEREKFQLAAKKTDLRRKFSLPIEAKILLFVGRLEADKGVFELLEALQKIRQNYPNLGVHLALVGPITDPSVVSKIEQLGLSDCTTLFGLRTPNEIPYFMAAADCLVLPSHTEGLPNVVLEAMAARLPVIASDVGGIPDIVHDGETGWLIPAGKVEPLAKALLEALSLPQERQIRAQKAYDLIAKNYTWERHAKCVEQVFLQAIKTYKIR